MRDGQGLTLRAEDHVLVRDHSWEAQAVDAYRTLLAAAGVLQGDLLGPRVGQGFAAGGRQPARGGQGGARGRIGLGLGVGLDDIGRFEVRGGDLGQAHHQHGADGEVGDHRAADPRAVGVSGKLVDLLCTHARGTDHGGDPGRKRRLRVLKSCIRRGEVNHRQRSRRERDGEIIAQVDLGHDGHVRLVGDGRGYRPAHLSARAADNDADLRSHGPILAATSHPARSAHGALESLVVSIS